MKIITKCLALFVKLKQKPNSDKMPIDSMSSHACTKPNVVGSKSQTMYDYVMSNKKDVCIMNDVLFENYYQRRMQYDKDFRKFWLSQGFPIERHDFNCHLAGIGIFKLKGEVRLNVS